MQLYFCLMPWALACLPSLVLKKEWSLNFSVGVCIALGTITASFGGVIRDVLLNNVPLVFRKEIYALASIIGGFIYYLLKQQ